MNTKTYIIRESDGPTFFRRGTAIRAKNLTSAKRYATRNQCFVGTNLRIESETGILLALKMSGQKWEEVES